MPKGRRSPAPRQGSPRSGASRGAKGGKAPAKAGGKAPAKRPARSQDAAPAAPPASTAPFRLGTIPGATPGKWIDLWNERRTNPIELVPLAVADQRRALVSGEVDAAIVRLPIDRDDLHVIPLYDEVAVAVVPVDSHLTAAEELEASDLAGEVVITPADDVLGMPMPPGSVEPAFDAPLTTEDAVAVVASGVGVVVVPMSLARLHHRRDIDRRPLRDGPSSSVALAWVADRESPDIDAFVGIVRGRTANSSR